MQQGLLLKVSALENESKENMERLEAEILKKSEEIDTLQKEIIKLEQHADSVDKEVTQLHNTLEEKEQCILQNMQQEKKLGDQLIEVLKQIYSTYFIFLNGLCNIYVFCTPFRINHY